MPLSALLELCGAGTSKHRGPLSFFDREFVRTGGPLFRVC
jgi:hypothetical protein